MSDYPILAEHGRWRVQRGHYHDLLQFIGPTGDVADIGDLDVNYFETLDDVDTLFSAREALQAKRCVGKWHDAPKREAAAC